MTHGRCCRAGRPCAICSLCRATTILRGFPHAELSRFYTRRLVTFIAKSKLNSGIRAFVTCVRELAEHAAQKDRAFRLPYEIKDDTCCGVSLLVGRDPSMQWTRALKCLATDLKWLLAWSSKTVAT